MIKRRRTDEIFAIAFKKLQLRRRTVIGRYIEMENDDFLSL